MKRFIMKRACIRCHRDRPLISFARKTGSFVNWCEVCITNYTKPCRVCGEPYERGHHWYCSIQCQIKARCENIDDPTACWPWRGAVRENGYGVVHVRRADSSWSLRSPARAIYAAIHGEVPRTFSVLNTCGTKNCCNPDHLKLEIQELQLETPDAITAS